MGIRAMNTQEQSLAEKAGYEDGWEMERNE
jgi:hypothetical protein